MNKTLFHFSRYRAEVLYVMLSAFAVCLGGIIYIFFRPSDHVFFEWIRGVGLNHWLNNARELSGSTGLALPEWLVYSLPNGLWAFAYALLITFIWGGSKFWLKYFWMSSIPLLILGFEVLQYAMIIPGTFSMQDLVFGIAGLTIGIFVGIKITEPGNHENTVE